MHKGEYNIEVSYSVRIGGCQLRQYLLTVASTGDLVGTGNILSESEEQLAGMDPFLNEIEEMNCFKEKDSDDEDGIKCSNKINIQL